MRESELQANTTQSELQAGMHQFTYSLSLSSQPRLPVTVHVNAARSGGNVTCINQADRFQLATSTLVFSNENFNEPQTVVTMVQVDDTYQGALGITFSHRVVGGGFDWEALPVSLTLLDDDACPPGAFQDEDENNVRTCQCGEGFFVETRDASFCSSVTSCRECPAGTACTGEESLEEMLVLPGYFRITEKVATVIECPVFDACNSHDAMNRIAGDSLCDATLGHEGPLCMVCHTGENETWYWEGQKCVLCEGEKQNAIIFFAVAFGTGLLLVVDAAGPGISRKVLKKAKALFKRRYPTMGKWIEKQKEVMEELTLKLQTKCNVTKSRPAPRSFLFQPTMRPKLICLDAAIVGFVGLCSLCMLHRITQPLSFFCYR